LLPKEEGHQPLLVDYYSLLPPSLVMGQIVYVNIME
jgi:hypothetical protein